MTALRPFTASAVPDEVMDGIRARAGAADRGEVTLATDLAALHDAGLLRALVEHLSPGGDALSGAQLLRRIGRANLATGRIVEGHGNALQLIRLYGTPAQVGQAMAAAQQGHVFGVWGADTKEPAVIVARDGDRVVLQGKRQFCSGLGLLSHALLPVQTDAGPLLLLADVRDTGRADASRWQVSGMRATASGHFRLDGLDAQIIGAPGDYLREPHFEGGVWRYCALHCGGLEALADCLRAHLRARGQTDDPHQAARLAQLVICARTARLWVDAACVAVATSPDHAASVAQVLLAREAVEEACLSGIGIVERAMGTAAFGSAGAADRIRRDLSFFLRQANLDGKRAAAARHLIAEPRPIGEIW